VTPGFGAAVAFTLRYEGKYVNDPRDPGGATNFGITQASLDEWLHLQRLGGVSVSQLTVELLDVADAIAIYRELYWKRCRGDELPPELALVVFDGSVNLGVAASIRLLQRALWIDDDGVPGTETIAAANRAPVLRMAWTTMSLRRAKYLSTPASPFLAGWLNRMEGLRAEIGL
jgi:lysozyme family protein